ncbi:MAG: HYR domain-containing protein [Phycisphaerales bacterium]|nr:MAG: HYR domain-containing protein [Phycisphaerales bacterium]
MICAEPTDVSKKLNRTTSEVSRSTATLVVHLLILCVFLALSSSPAAAQVGSWTTGSITTGGDTNNFVAVTTDSAGTFHGVWRPESGSEGFIEIGAFDGTSWTKVSSFSPADSSLFDSLSDDVSVAIDSAGNYHVAFKASKGGGTTSERGIFYAKYDGTSWTIEKVQTSTDPHGWKNYDDPRIDVDSADTPHMTYQFSDANDPDLENIRYAVWGTPWSISNVDSTAGNMELFNGGFALDSSDKAHLSYGKEDGDAWDADLMYANNVSGSFVPTRLVDVGNDDPSGEGVGDTDLELDTSGNVYISYSYGEYGASSVRLLTNAGGSFGAANTAVGIGDHGSPNAIGINGSAGLKVIVYRDSDSTPSSIRAATRIDSDSWQDEQVWYNPGDDFGTGSFMDAVMNGSGNIMVLFHRNSDDTGDDRRVMFAYGTLSAGAVCGDGNVEGNEDCDGDECCASDCTFSASGTACGDATETDCDGPDMCDGSGVCNDNLAVDGSACDDGDACSTIDSCNAGICVGGPDETDPTIDCSGIDSARSTDPGVCTFTMPGTGFDPTFDDNCPDATLSNDYGAAPDPNTLAGAVFPEGSTSVGWTVTDGVGLSAMCPVDIIISDNEKPTITCPAYLEVEPTSTAGAIVAYDAPVADDNCPGVTFACDPPAGSLFAIGETPVTCTATDAAGSQESCTFTVKVFTAAEVISNVVDAVTALGDSGALNRGQANAVSRKLEHAARDIERGKEDVACNTLKAFINHITALTYRADILSEAEGQPLIDSAINARAALGCDPLTKPLRGNGWTNRRR